MPHRLTWLDVFTSTPFTGNGLAVIHDADDLDDATMQAIALETNQSETTFVQTADADGADYRNRIFTLTGELRFAGHPSLGTAVAVARARGETSARYVQQTIAGLQPIEVELDGNQARTTMLQGPAEFGPELEAGAALAALGLDPADLHPELPPQVVATGVNQVMLPLGSAAALGRARPDRERIVALKSPFGAVVVFAFAVDGDQVTARSFLESPDGVIEDPATGSAAGPVCAYLHRRAGLDAITIAQGAAIDRPSRMDASIEGDHVRVGGEAVVVFDATLL